MQFLNLLHNLLQIPRLHTLTRLHLVPLVRVILMEYQQLYEFLIIDLSQIWFSFVYTVRCSIATAKDVTPVCFTNSTACAGSVYGLSSPPSKSSSFPPTLQVLLQLEFLMVHMHLQLLWILQHFFKTS